MDCILSFSDGIHLKSGHGKKRNVTFYPIFSLTLTLSPHGSESCIHKSNNQCFFVHVVFVTVRVGVEKKCSTHGPVQPHGRTRGGVTLTYICLSACHWDNDPSCGRDRALDLAYESSHIDVQVIMPEPTVELFSTSILSNHKVRTRHERFTSVLAIKKIPYVYHDLASDDEAKRRWRTKAKDPQLPGLLVNNEWKGSYDEFEEAVEFGELELFLGVSPAPAQPASAAPHPAQSATSSKDPSLYPTLPYAAQGAGRWKEPDADQFISSLGIKEEEIDDADIDAMLADLGNLTTKPALAPHTKYVPSKEAAIKPLRLAKMGPTTSHQRMPSGSPVSSPSPSAATRASPIARFSATQRSTKALAAEAAALTDNRKTSGALLREAVSQGKTLDDAMEQSRIKHIVGQDNLDDLFASLGLSNVDIGDDEVDQFLEKGHIPQGLRSGGDRVHRASSVADKARDQTVARDLALKAKEKGHGANRSISNNEAGKSVGLQPASQIGSAADDASTTPRTSITSAPTSVSTETSSEKLDVAGSDSSKAAASPADDMDGTDKAKDGSEDKPAAANKDVAATAAVSEPAGKEDTEAVKEPSSSSKVSEPADAEPQQQAAAVRESREAMGEETTAFETGRAKTEAADAQSAEHIARTSVSKPDVVIPSVSESSSKSLDDDSEKLGGMKTEPEKVSDEMPMATTKSEAEQIQGPELAASTSRKSIADEKEAATAPVWDVHKVEEDGVTSATAAITPPAAMLSLVEDVKDEADARISGDGKQTGIDQDRTPTNELPQDPIASQSQPAEKARAEEGDDSLLQLAQAAMLASQLDDQKAGQASLPSSLPEITEPATNGRDLNTDQEITSPAKSTASALSPSPAATSTPVRDQSRGKSSSPSPSRLEAGMGRQTSRQASGSSSHGVHSSSRRAIDVSRPIDPSISSPPPPSSGSDPSSSPDTKKKFGGIRGFNLGRDKDKDKEKEKKDKQATETNRPSAGGGRHERTISQILREADAVLGLDGDDDDDADGSFDDDTEDSKMFGHSSVDVDVDIDAGPTPAVRSSSRKF